MDGAALGALAAHAPRSILLATTAGPSSSALCGQRCCGGRQSPSPPRPPRCLGPPERPPLPRNPSRPSRTLHPLCPHTTPSSPVPVAFQPGQVVRAAQGYRGRTDSELLPLTLRRRPRFRRSPPDRPRPGGEPGTGSRLRVFELAGPGRVR